MDRRRIIVLIAAGILGLSAVFLVNVYLQGAKKRQFEAAQRQQAAAQRPPPQGKTAEVLVARTNITRGSALDRRMFQGAAVPLEFVQPMVATSFNEIKDKVALLPILKGEQLLLNKIGSYGEEVATLTFSMKVPEGKRAVSIMIDRISAAGGMVKTGDNVDVFCNLPLKQEGAESTVTIPLFQNVSVLFVSSAEAGSRTARKSTTGADLTVTLALTPIEAAALLFAQKQGDIFFVLRSPADEQITNVPPIDSSTLFQLISPFPRTQRSDIDLPTGMRKIEVFKGIEEAE